MPILARPALIATTLVYFVVVLVIGVWASRRTRTSRDFFIAGQSLGLVVTGLATMSAAFSGFVFLGGPGLTYRMGLASLFIVVPVGLTPGLLCWVVAKRLRLLAEVRDVLTIPDAILCRYRSRTASGLAALAVVVGTIGYLGAQLLAMGILIESIFDMRAVFGAWSLAVAMGVGLVVVLVYAIGGGMIAGVYTDLVQGALMMVAAVGVFVCALDAGGGIGEITRRIASSEAFGSEFLDPLGKVPVFTALGFFFVFSVGTLGQPHMLHKFYMLRDPRRLKWFPLVLGLSQSLCLLIWVGIGLAVPALVASGRLEPLALADEAAPVFLMEYTPGILAGLVFASILAAIMSTADSFVNIGSAALVRDLPKALGFEPRHELTRGRLAVVGVALAAAISAYLYGDLIALLGTFAFGTFAAALAPALAVGLNWRRVTARAASASIATGLLVNLALELLGRQSVVPSPFPPGVLPSAVALAASFTVLFAVSWLGSDASDAVEADIAATMES